MRNLFYKIFSNIIGSFSGRKILLHLGAVVSTYLVVISGLDWFYFVSARKEIIDAVLFPAVFIGFWVPLFLPLFILFLGKVFRIPKLVNTAWGLGQAAFLGWLMSSIYKAFTGRIQPDMANMLTDISRNFNFGFWEHGIFWGWPSSHTTIAFAMAVALIVMYPRRKWIKWPALIYAFYIGIGISVNIHWFSEFVAGALIGTAIGLTVGRSFRQRIS